MKNILVFLGLMSVFSCGDRTAEIPGHYKHVDQVLWVVNDLDNVINHWKNLGFVQVIDLDTVIADLKNSRKVVKIRLAKANLGGANITWIQPLGGGSVFDEFLSVYGNGAMSLVYRMESEKALQNELNRLADIGLEVKEKISIETPRGNMHFVLMDTWEKGKYYLGYTWADESIKLMQELTSANLHNMKLNQYAFAIRNENVKSVSHYWQSIGFPEFEMNHPELGNKHYYDSSVDHDLIQGWQKHGDIAYEWCIPVSTPIVYDDHIKKHGEGIHHLAYAVKDMDKVLNDYRSKGYVVSMGGTWGEEGKPGSGRYEYIDLEDAGGVTMELLWSFE
jgi:4-hydroxyphenylpyruvate dioxygenase-like putative hemolysin